MKNHLVNLFFKALIILAIAPATQADITPYVSLSGGYATLEDSDVRVMDTMDVGEISADGWQHSYNIEGAIGFAWSSEDEFTTILRMELALSYQENDLDEYTDDIGALGPPGASYSLDGEVEIISLMVNGYFDIPTGTALTPYILAGIGAADVEADILGDTLGDTVFAYQVGVGLAWALNDHVILDLKYKYFQTDEVEDSDLEVEISSHQIQVGLRYQF